VNDLYYQALTARDARFDGVFFVGVTTTGIYCRPVCTARTAGKARCRFFHSAVEAEREGFRACFRCRPELAPGLAPVDAVPRLVARAVRRIEAGALNDDSIEALAAELGVSDRHLRRAMTDELGVSPVELAQTVRLAFAKRLIQDTALPLTQVAFGAGFRSVRRFNAAFLERFGRSPTELKRAAGGPSRDDEHEVTLRLDYRPPLAWPELLEFLGARRLAGVEVISPAGYARTVASGTRAGWVEVSHDGRRLVARVSSGLLGELIPLTARLRTLFDLDAHPARIDAVLAADELLGPSVARTPGLRVPGAFDGFETAVRAVLGQQVSVKGATTLAGRLVERFGTRTPTGWPEGLTHFFPAAKVLASAAVGDVAELGLPKARAATLVALAVAVRDGLQLAPGMPVEETMAKLQAIPGIGPWTAQYLAMRALSWPDAFPASDLGVLHALGMEDEAASLARAEAWRPWRAYATLHLWRKA